MSHTLQSFSGLAKFPGWRNSRRPRLAQKRCHAVERGSRLGDVSPELGQLSNKQQKKNKNKKNTKNSVEDDGDGVVALFGFDEGWDAEVLDDDDDDDFDDDDDDDGLVEIDLQGQGSATGFEDNAAAIYANKALSALPDYVLQELEEHQRHADAVNAKTKAKRAEKNSKSQRHQKLRIIGGSFAGRRLFSPTHKDVRPMMEVVRGAVFNMLLSHCGGFGGLPEGSRWLDLFAGTGSVGLEALSRGCAECTFIELDPLVVSSILEPNIQKCGCEMSSNIQTMRAEDFLKKAGSGRWSTQRPYDFISVCPPYLKVSYPEIQELLVTSGLIHDETIMFMEYPRQLSREVQDKIGPLEKVKDRRYGRTYMAVYAKP